MGSKARSRPLAGWIVSVVITLSCVAFSQAAWAQTVSTGEHRSFFVDLIKLDNLAKLLGLVAVIPTAAGGATFAYNYITGRGRLVRDEQIFDSQKVTFDLIEQIARLEALKKAPDGPLANEDLLQAYDYTKRDFIGTLASVRANVQLRTARRVHPRPLPGPDYRFREIRNANPLLRYFTLPRPKSATQWLVAGLYYYYLMLVGFGLVSILVSVTLGFTVSPDGAGTAVVGAVMTAIVCVLFNLMLRWIWGGMFTLRERYEAHVKQAHDLVAATAPVV